MELQTAPAEVLARYEALADRFAAVYEEVVGAGDLDGWVRDDWQARNAALEDAVLPRPPRDFIRHPSVLHSMFVGARYARHELPALVARHGDRLRELLDEDAVGEPPTIPGHDGTYETSSNLVHHLHHLTRYEEATGARLAEAATVVEWGGGYGSMARLLRRLVPPQTIVVVDTPLFTAIQWLFLSAVLGPDEVDLGDGSEVRAGAVTLVPVTRAEHLAVDADLFLSTWARNESPPRAQDLVVDRDWFGARSLLLGMHGTDPFAERVLDVGASAHPVGDWMENQFYFVR